MRNFIVRLLANAIALWVASRLVGGVTLTDEPMGILWVALLFGVVNALVKPIVMTLSFPVIFLTLGLFVFVINALLFMLTAGVTDALAVSGFWAALLGSLVVSVVAMVLNGILKESKKG
ncbi:MAG: phage holin family protein [Gemmatimonadota bacterium]|jgi:putative membrane protein